MKIASKRKEVAIKAAKSAGKISMDNFSRPFKIKAKGDRDLVTDVDLKVQKEIVRIIKKSYPGDDILSEEKPTSSSKSEFRWIIDPIDGTHNFIKKIAIFGTSIALEYKGEVTLGVIYMPVTKELYLAEKGKGAYLNAKRIHVSKRALKESTIVYDSSIRYNRVPMLSCLGELAHKAFNVRMFGSTVRALSYLAEGKVDLEVEFNDKVWDFAAGLLLVEEAGGKATDFQGRPWKPKNAEYVASNGKIHKEVLSLIAKSLRK